MVFTACALFCCDYIILVSYIYVICDECRTKSRYQGQGQGQVITSRSIILLHILWIAWVILGQSYQKQYINFILNFLHKGCVNVLNDDPRFFDQFLAATKQLYKWYFPSVRPSVCLSVCPSVRHTFLTMFPSSYHHEIFRSYYQWQKWRPCKRSRSEVKGQGHRGHNPTLPFPDCNSSLNSRMMMKWCIQLGSA